MMFDTLFPHIDGAPPTPVAQNAQAFYEWALENNHPTIGFYNAYPGLVGPRHPNAAGRSEVTIRQHLIALLHGSSPTA